LIKFASGVETPWVGSCALSFLVSGTAGGITDAGAGAGAAGGETEAGAGAGADAGAGFGGGCAKATIEAAATANMTIVLFIKQTSSGSAFLSSRTDPD